tara:strand:- start:1568 stop:1837 length:270 start_codon:yes stop_codon:yes gene_type:complete
MCIKKIGSPSNKSNINSLFIHKKVTDYFIWLNVCFYMNLGNTLSIKKRIKKTFFYIKKQYFIGTQQQRRSLFSYTFFWLCMLGKTGLIK